MIKCNCGAEAKRKPLGKKEQIEILKKERFNKNKNVVLYQCEVCKKRLIKLTKASK